MNLKLNETYHGFILQQEKNIQEIKALGRIFLHDKSGARLISLSAEDDNKVFAVNFRTPPVDSTGIPHILEHSALCGSRKFPSKEPFIELAKGSLNTFLNAMTFPDKTMYPVASRNTKDFFNLMDVYLDAVFYPNIYRYPEIFMQEGWHHELDSPEAPVVYRGVVYNEMKGVFSTPEALLFSKIPESLFPDTTYGFESGGDPDVIPELTYERFIDFHKKFYHPSNSYILLYGDGDLDEQLRFLNEQYLSEFDRKAVDSEINLQAPFTEPRELDVSFPVLPGEELRDKTFFSLNFVVDRATNASLALAFTILEYLLLETPAAPLKKTLQDSKLGKDVFGAFERELLQPVFSIVLKNSEEERRERFRSVVMDSLERLVREGIDKRQVEAAINIHEFRLREADFRGLPKGLVYGMAVMNSWLYGGDPFAHLEYEGTLSEVRQSLSSDYFERLIQAHLINNPHQTLLTVKPEAGLAERKQKELEQKLEKFKKSLKGEAVDALIAQTAALRKRQTMLDSAEDLEKIPLLELKDIDPEAEKLPLEESEEHHCRVLFHPLFTGGIAYVNLYFDTTTVPQRDLPYLRLLTDILSKVSTERFSYAELSNQILINTGGIYFDAETFGHKEDDSQYYPKLLVKSKTLVRKIPDLFDLIGEIIGGTRFDEKKRFKEIIQESKSRFEMGIYDRGHYVSAGRLLSYFSPQAAYAETMGGISYFHFLSDLERNFDGKADGVMENLKRVAALVFNRKHLLVSVTASTEDLNAFRDHFPRILERTGDTVNAVNTYAFPNVRKNEGLFTPGKVQYVAKGYNFKKLGFEYRGSLQVLRTIASLDYLWNRVRVQGGAYGSFARFSREGNMYFCSYRDPNLRETLDVYDGAGGYFRAFDAGNREIRKYIIGTVSRLDHPLTPSMKGEAATDRYIRGIAQEDVQRVREEVLATGKKDIHSAADLISLSMDQNFICVLGNEGKIREHSTLFDELVRVFE
jgi:Zn-dependent M16 (insulinase) family peptidase